MKDIVPIKQDQKIRKRKKLLKWKTADIEMKIRGKDKQQSENREREN